MEDISDKSEEVPAFGMLYLHSLLKLSASLLPSREQQQVALFIVVAHGKSERYPYHQQ
jgi:hypothetical protein